MEFLHLHLSLPIPSGLGVIGGVGSLSTGSPSGRGSGRNTPASCTVRPSKALKQGSSCAALEPHPAKGRIQGGEDNQPTEIPHVGTFAGHIGQRHQLVVLHASAGSPPFWRASTLTSECMSFVVEWVPPQGALTREPKGTKRAAIGSNQP